MAPQARQSGSTRSVPDTSAPRRTSGSSPGSATATSTPARELGRRHPIGRIGDPRDVAYQALYLDSDESAFVTGSMFACDGGFAL